MEDCQGPAVKECGMEEGERGKEGGGGGREGGREGGRKERKHRIVI